MPIEMSCYVCGRDLFLRDELAGRQIRCPDCQAMLTVPAARPTPKVERVESYVPPPAPPPAPKYDALSERVQDTPTLPEVLPAPQDVERAKPRRQPPRQEGQANNLAGSLIGGLLMMLLGGGWAWVGWGARRFPVHAVILFVLGLTMFLRSVAGLIKR